MAVALIISSFVSASRIGGGAQQYVLAAHRIDPVLAPTVLFGRSPATGAKGEVTAPQVLRRMLGDIEADAVFGELDLVITGHFSLPEQVEIAASLLERVRAQAVRPPVVVVDPIMGDEPNGLYVGPEVADALAARLVPLADWITPNLWELGRLAGRPIADAKDALAACEALGRKALVTSVAAGKEEIGLLFCNGDERRLFAHRRLDRAPNGAGDLVTASFGAGLVQGLAPAAAAERAARAVADTVQLALKWRSTDLPIVALAERVANPTAEIRIERL
jgi:pyridoxine kinase